MLRIVTNKLEQPKLAKERPTADGLPPLKEGERDDIVPGWRVAPGTYPEHGKTPFTVEWNNDIRHDELRVQLTEQDRENLADAGLGNTELAAQIKRLSMSGMTIEQTAAAVGMSVDYIKKISAKIDTAHRI